eukprot:CAMPEP_0117049940 /NCGR_PEP_ID=MMETSP0472-20121206/34479_1 /TAXON_ID=693140 ORGANISM="Tiarina fusus, Strain LIS" /NCGR_SAMPLE_ID=MMETSP0472 /ASSEMBLY_ACC=CAM_ASM_000603 /LENGTH=77 /DNA_ID=CAMNT_0004763529 /DNA_START=75 /DNA_END=308 /DNA_ORIENTATION=-
MPSMTKQHVAGNLGVSKNPIATSSTQRGARQAILQSVPPGQRGAVAGKIGVAQNPAAPKAVQHSARVDVMNQVGSKK